MTVLPDDLKAALLDLFPRLKGTEPSAELVTISMLVDSEAARRGGRDGVCHTLGLLQGPLLKEAYEHFTRVQSGSDWTLGAVVVDVRELDLTNQFSGFPMGTATSKAVASSFTALFPSAKVVRIHGDAFAALMPPSSELRVIAKMQADVVQALAPIPLTVALLELTIARPSHWQVLGPLVWAEAERAYGAVCIDILCFRTRDRALCCERRTVPQVDRHLFAPARR
jgi:hypothetical protein